jgi:hypothetical protein
VHVIIEWATCLQKKNLKINCDARHPFLARRLSHACRSAQKSFINNQNLWYKQHNKPCTQLCSRWKIKISEMPRQHLSMFATRCCEQHGGDCNLMECSLTFYVLYVEKHCTSSAVTVCEEYFFTSLRFFPPSQPMCVCVIIIFGCAIKSMENQYLMSSIYWKWFSSAA